METVLITGAARRLGALIAEDLARKGCFIWIHYRTHQQEAFALRDRIIASGGKADCICCDLRETDEISGMLDTIKNSRNGDLTTLINCASVFVGKTLTETTREEWDLVLNTNLRSVWFLSCQFAAGFSGARRIISIGDAGVSRGMYGHAVYGLSKFALKYLTEQMAAAFAPDICVNLLSPGLALRGDAEEKSVWQQRLARVPLGSGDIITSILRGISFLMEDPGMTGAELLIDNGYHLPAKYKK